MNRALAIRHVAFEDLGILQELLQARGFSPSYRDAGIDRLDDLLLAHDDLLIVLGGPIGACEEDRYPFLADELRLIGNASATMFRYLAFVSARSSSPARSARGFIPVPPRKLVLHRSR